MEMMSKWNAMMWGPTFKVKGAPKIHKYSQMKGTTKVRLCTNSQSFSSKSHGMEVDLLVPDLLCKDETVGFG